MLGLILKEFPVNKVQCSTLQIVVLRNGISAKFLFFSESVNVNFWNRWCAGNVSLHTFVFVPVEKLKDSQRLIGLIQWYFVGTFC